MLAVPVPRRGSLAIPLALGFAASPASGATAQFPGPDLTLQDSLILEETGEHYIAQPLAMFVAADGSILVSDGFAETVMRYDASGRLVGSMGRRGEGPGEFRQLGGVGFVTTDVAGFLDESGRLELFALATGTHRGRVRMDMHNRTSSFAVRGDSVWFAGINSVSYATFGTVAMDNLTSAAGGDEEQASPILLDRGTAPAPYAETHSLARSLPHAFLAVGESDVVLGFTGSPFLLRADHEGNVLDTARIAQGSRRGEPDEAELIRLMRGEQARSQEQMQTWMRDFFGSVSFVRDLSRDYSGNVYTLHQDSRRDEGGTMTEVKLYVAVTRFDDDRGCGDTLIPTSDVGAPVPLLQGNTLWILDQRLQRSATSDIATVVRRFEIDPQHCTGAVR